MLDALNTLKTKVHETYKATSENFMDVLHESKFLEEGVLTPEEVKNSVRSGWLTLPVRRRWWSLGV